MDGAKTVEAGWEEFLETLESAEIKEALNANKVDFTKVFTNKLRDRP